MLVDEGFGVLFECPHDEVVGGGFDGDFDELADDDWVFVGELGGGVHDIDEFDELVWVVVDEFVDGGGFEELCAVAEGA